MRVTRLPWQWTGWVHTGATVVLAGAGPLRLSFDGFEEPRENLEAAERDRPSREELALVGADGRRGRLAVDRWLALSLVAATLGMRAPRVLRALGRAERGVLAGHVAASLAQTGCAVAVSLDEPRFVPEQPCASFTLLAETPGLSGRLRLDLPPEWLSSSGEGKFRAAGSRGELRATLGRLPVAISVELATTDLPASEWAQAGPGDAVLFTGCPFLTASAWPVSLRVGDYAADAVTEGVNREMKGGGAVIFGGPFVAVPARAPLVDDAHTRHRIAKGPSAMSIDPNDQHLDERLKVIGAAPIEVVAEVGRLTLRGEELLGLQRGSVLPLGNQGQAVSLLVGGQPWARGELVNVDGELGVRITELSRS
jgi:type III secretion system YscQ/HrcQ family protein